MSKKAASLLLIVLLSGLPMVSRPAALIVPMRNWSDRVAIMEVLAEQQSAWNKGDVSTFMRGYWNSPELTFAGSGGIARGWESVLARYKREYPDEAAMGQLNFSNLKCDSWDRKRCSCWDSGICTAALAILGESSAWFSAVSGRVENRARPHELGEDNDTIGLAGSTRERDLLSPWSVLVLRLLSRKETSGTKFHPAKNRPYLTLPYFIHPVVTCMAYPYYVAASVGVPPAPGNDGIEEALKQKVYFRCRCHCLR